MTSVRQFVLTVLLGTSLAACSGAAITEAPPEAQLTDTQRAKLANQLVAATSSSGEGSIAAAFAAAAIVGGAQAHSVDVGTAVTGGYYATAVQVTQTGSPDLVSAIFVWRPGADGVPTDFALTLGAGEGTNSFATAGENPPTAFGLVCKAPTALWMATQGTTSLHLTEAGEACRDVTQRLAYAGYTGTCKLAKFTGGVEVTSAAPVSDPSNTAQGSTTFSLQDTAIWGVVINVTGPATAANVVSTR